MTIVVGLIFQLMVVIAVVIPTNKPQLHPAVVYWKCLSRKVGSPFSLEKSWGSSTRPSAKHHNSASVSFYPRHYIPMLSPVSPLYYYIPITSPISPLYHYYITIFFHYIPILIGLYPPDTPFGLFGRGRRTGSCCICSEAMHR